MEKCAAFMCYRVHHLYNTEASYTLTFFTSIFYALSNKGKASELFFQHLSSTSSRYKKMNSKVIWTPDLRVFFLSSTPVPPFYFLFSFPFSISFLENYFD